MPNSSSAFGQVAYIPEATPNVIPTTGNGVKLRMTNPTMKPQVSTVKSNEIRADRLSTGLSVVDMDIDGGFDFEMSGKEYDPFLEGLLGSNFAHYGAVGIGTAFSATTSANTVTAAVAPTTTSAFTTIGLGQWFKLVAPAGSSQAIKDYFADKWFKTHASTASTATVLTLDASTPITAPGLVTGIAGYQVTSSQIQNGSVAKSFTMEYSLSDVTQFLTFSGMRVSSMDLSMEVGSLITGSFGFLGQNHTIQGTTLLPGSLVASQTLENMNSVNDIGAIYENGASLLSSTSFVKSAKINLNNNLRGQKSLATFGNGGVGYGELELGGSLEVYFQDATYYQKWLRGTTTSLSLGMADGAGNGYLLDFEKIQFKDGGMGGSGRTEDVMLTLPFSAFFNPSTGRGVRITRAVAA